jgi:hypothetical protein
MSDAAGNPIVLPAHYFPLPMLTFLMGSMNPCPFDLQNNLTFPSCVMSWSILPVMDSVLVRRVMITSGTLRPSGRGNGEDLAKGRGGGQGH